MMDNVSEKNFRLIKALTDPQTPAEWAQAMTNPLSPINQKMMQMMVAGALERNMIIEIMVERDRMTQAEKEKEKEALIAAISKEQASNEEKIKHALSDISPPPQTPSDIGTIEKIETLKLYIDQLEEYDRDCTVKMDKLKDEMTASNQQVRELHSQIASIETEWNTIQKKKSNELGQLLDQEIRENNLEAYDHAGNLIQAEELKSKLMQLFNLSLPEGALKKEELEKQGNEPQKMVAKNIHEMMKLELLKFVGDDTQQPKNQGLLSFIDRHMEDHCRVYSEKAKQSQELKSKQCELKEDLLIKHQLFNQHKENREEVRREMKSAREMLKQFTTELMKQSKEEVNKTLK